MRVLALLLGFAAATSLAAGEPPTLSRLFPPGAARGTTTEIELKGKFGDGEPRFWSSHSDVQWEKGEKENWLKVTIGEDASPGLVYMRIWNDDGVSGLQRFVVGHLRETLEVEPNDQLSDATPADSDRLLVNGVLEKKGDVDHFKLDIGPGETLVASIQAERELQSEVDASLQIVDNRGNVLAQNLDYHGLDPQIVWTAPGEKNSGVSYEVFVRVFGFPAAPNSTIGLAGGENYIYRLTITKGPWCEGVLPLSVSTSEPTLLAPVGWNLPADLQMTVTPEAISEIQKSEQAFGFALPEIPASHRLAVTSAIPVVIPAAPTSPPSVISLPAAISGNICFPQQKDRVEFDAVKDAKWTLKLESRALGFPLDAVLTIEDAETGKQLVTKDDNAKNPDPIIQWTVPTDGRYRVSVADINGAATDNNLYRLEIVSETPSFKATVADTSFTGKITEPLEIPIKVERLAGFDQPIEFTLEPATAEGFEAKAVISETTGETAKEVKLVLTCSTAGVAQFRVIAKVGETRENDQPVTDTTHGLDDLWITIQ